MDPLDRFSAPQLSPPFKNPSLTSEVVTVPLSTSSPSTLLSSSSELAVSSPSTILEGPNGTVPCDSNCVNGLGPRGSDVVTCDTQSLPDTGVIASVSLDSDVSAAMENDSTVFTNVIAPPDPVSFVPSLGSWAKPLFFKPPATPPEPSTPSGYDPAIVGNQLAAMWPSLNDKILNKPLKGRQQSRSLQPPIEKLPPPELKADGTLRFPWAARLNSQSRNLYRAATPTYRLDGTPEVSIPSKVLRLGPENKDEYIIGKFHRCSLPPGGLIHAVVNKIWGRSCKITCKKVGDSSYMFHIPHQPTRQWIIQRGVWHIDDCLLFVLPWIPEGSFKVPEIYTLPVWVILKNIPDCCYSRLGISHVASGLGEPILTHKPRLDFTSMGEAKVLVEMELDKAFPKLIALDDKQGSIFLVNVEYTWIPSTCERCGNLGHKAKRCLLPSKPLHDTNLQQKEKDEINGEVPVVDIDLIMQQRENDTSSSEAPSHNNPLINGTASTAVSVHDIPLVKESEVPSVVAAAEKSQSLQTDLVKRWMKLNWSIGALSA
ncbi:uncharacterized protein LOC108806284 [Raphanus sativus]|uniref:Uncharacterized protein LOC108806284 n=1 Tax=Raphanus sativus TaxID=3726 RepID=A0A6J0JE09_RAPSA|nr:uncharacterized protein LOC108806284 [Raphanus sativus]